MRLLLILIGISFSALLSGQKDKTISCKWRNDPAGELKIDDSEYMKDKKSLTMYYISNDNENFYLDMKVAEALEQNKILKVGMTVWINPDGKSVKKTGVRFPVGSEYSGPRKKDFETQINPPTPLSQATTIQLVGYEEVQPSKFPADNSDNVRGKVKYDKDGNLIYSLVIPFANMPVVSAESEKTTAMTIGIEYGAPPEMGMSSRPPSSGSNMKHGASNTTGGSRSGSGGGGMTGGAPGGSARPTSASADLGSPVLIWVKEIALAKKN